MTRSVMGLAAVLALGLLGAHGEEGPRRSSFVVRAYEFDRGNVAVSDVGMAYADAEPVIFNGGPTPNATEYDLDFPVTARYAISGRYAAAESRPVDLRLDGVDLVRGFAGTTGSWQSSTAIWELLTEVDIEAGRHTVSLVCPGPCMPHIVALRFESSAPFPAGWRRRPKPIEAAPVAWSGTPEPGRYGYEAYVRPDGFVDAPGDYDPVVPYERVPAPAPRAERLLEYLLMGEGRYTVRAEMMRDEMDETWSAHLSVVVSEDRTDTGVLPLDAERIRRMAEHTRFLADQFRNRWGLDLREARDEAGALLAAVERLESTADDEAKWRGMYDLYVAAYRLKNRVALSNPLLSFGKLLFAKRQTYDTSHIYTTYFDGSHRFGGSLAMLSPPRPDGPVEAVLAGLPETGIFRDPDVSWDGARALFSYKADGPSPYRIYEVNLDGSGARQLTDSEYDDIDPCYLPDGRIMFVSTRCRRVVLCHNAFTVSVLYTMSSDGSDVRCASSNTVNDFTPSVLADGSVAYTRWEYVDKQLGNNQSLWVVNPDGTMPRHMTGEHWGPITFWEPRQVPGSSLLVCTLAPHMPIAVGPIALVDPADVCSSPARFTNITPELPPPSHFGWARRDVGYYCNPYPLSEEYFIVSYAYGPDDREPAGYGLYLLDRWNNRDLIYRDPGTSCFEAFPVTPRRRPPAYPEQGVGAGDATGTMLVMDVYQGLPDVPRGTVKYIRIVEEVPKPVAAECTGPRLQYPVVSAMSHLAVKRLLGTVPVEEDGSACFRVPADVPVYFAALDENMMEVQRMRAFTQVRAGERTACIGCHEARITAPANAVPLASRREPSTIEPPPDGVHAPDFAYDVQPVLDRHCQRCHSGADPAGKLDLSDTRTNLFNVAYENLVTRGYVAYVDANSSATLPLRPAKYYGSHASKLVQTLLTTHRERVRLSKADFERLVTWVDCNAPYYGTYVYGRKGTLGGRELLTGAVRAALQPVYDRRCASCHGGDVAAVTRVDFRRVDRSPMLLAPLARDAGGTERCGQAVFPRDDDPDALAWAEGMRILASEVASNPREDMLPERPPISDPLCRYVYRP